MNLENIGSTYVDIQNKIGGVCNMLQEESIREVVYISKILEEPGEINYDLKKKLYIDVVDRSHIEIQRGISMNYKCVFENTENFTEFCQILENSINKKNNVLDTEVKNYFIMMYQYFFIIKSIIDEVPRITLLNKRKLTEDQELELSDIMIQSIGVSLNDEIDQLLKELKEVIYEATYDFKLENIYQGLTISKGDIETKNVNIEDTKLDNNIISYMKLLILEAHDIIKTQISDEEIDSLLKDMFTNKGEEAKKSDHTIKN